MRKKLITVAIAATLLIGSAQVYAESVLGKGIIDAITDGFNTIKTYYVSSVTSDSTKLNNQYKDQVDKLVSDKVTIMLKQLDEHKAGEITRANSELDTYLTSVSNELDLTLNSKTAEVKASITTEVNNQITNIKDEINKELEKQLKDKLKK